MFWLNYHAFGVRKTKGHVGFIQIDEDSLLPVHRCLLPHVVDPMPEGFGLSGFNECLCRCLGFDAIKISFRVPKVVPY
jgi:hypothetical protein